MNTTTFTVITNHCIPSTHTQNTLAGQTPTTVFGGNYVTVCANSYVLTTCGSIEFSGLDSNGNLCVCATFSAGSWHGVINENAMSADQKSPKIEDYIARNNNFFTQVGGGQATA